MYLFISCFAVRVKECQGRGRALCRFVWLCVLLGLGIYFQCHQVDASALATRCTQQLCNRIVDSLPCCCLIQFDPHDLVAVFQVELYTCTWCAVQYCSVSCVDVYLPFCVALEGPQHALLGIKMPFALFPLVANAVPYATCLSCVSSPGT